MGFENDPFRDVNSDQEPFMRTDDNILDDNLDDEDESGNHERSRAQVYDDKKSRPRIRLIKKFSGVNSGADFNRPDEGNYRVGDNYNLAHVIVMDETGDGGAPSLLSEGRVGAKRKKSQMDGGGEEKRKKKRKEGKEDKQFKFRKMGHSGGGKSRNQEKDPEMKEMWDAIAGGSSEDDQKGVRTVDDDNFIDDSGVDPTDRYEHPHSPGAAPQAQDGKQDEEIEKLFNIRKKKKKIEKTAEEIAFLIENVMAELEVVAEEDAELNRQNKPAINKLKKLPLLTDCLSKKQLQEEFLDHGVLTLLKNWLEPLPDGSLPNINIRAAILQILVAYPIDLKKHDRREQVKKSGLGKVIMFLSKSDEETKANRKLAKDLVDKWSRQIFNKTERFEDMMHQDDIRPPNIRRPSLIKPMNEVSGMQYRDGDLDFAEISQRPKSTKSKSRQLITRPERMAMDFVMRPQSKIDPEKVRALAKQAARDQNHAKLLKKIQNLKAPKKMQFQAANLSAAVVS